MWGVRAFPDSPVYGRAQSSSRYQPDGTFISGRATRGMDRLAVRKDGAEVVVNVDTLFKQDVDLAGWAGAVVDLV